MVSSSWSGGILNRGCLGGGGGGGGRGVIIILLPGSKYEFCVFESQR